MARHHKSHKKHHKGHHLSHAKAEHMLEEKYGGHKGGELSHLAHRAHDRSEHRHARVHGEHYAGMEPRRRQELEDAGMIHEDHNAVANLPQNVMMKPYEMEKASYLPEDLDDTIRGVDRQIHEDDHQRMRHFKPHKY